MDFPGYPIAVINTSYSQLPAGSTSEQLEGPWSVATGADLPLPSWGRIALGIVGGLASAFHGSRRNGGSIFWGLTWFGLGAFFPVVTPVIAAAQGFGKCQNNCRIAPTANLSGRRRRSRR
jgi:hypothetical protein